jgi:hypothetical protein
MPRTIHTDVQLQEAAGHVKYEIDMLIYCSEILSIEYGSPPTHLATPHKNMALEAFLLHYRNLRAFLCPTLQRVADDDIIASDFLKEATARDLADATKLALDKERLDGMLSHLTYRRIGYIAGGNHMWRVYEMCRTMLFELQSFIGMLPPPMVPWFPNVSFLIQRASRTTVHTLAGPPVETTQASDKDWKDW